MRLYTEEVQVCIQATTKDSAGGNKANGAETVLETVKVGISERDLKRSDTTGKLVFSKLFEFELWVNPAYTLTVAHYFKYSGGILKIQSLKLDERKIKYHVSTEGIQ
jgi:hypothetical protein